MSNNIEKARNLLIKYKQNHIVSFMDCLSDSKKNDLANQVLKINFEEMKKLYKKTEEDIYTDLEEILPITAVNPDKLSIEEKQKYINVGEELIKNNKYALVTMAGRTRNKTADTINQKEHLKLMLEKKVNIYLK